jgi:hypothetical protein
MQSPTEFLEAPSTIKSIKRKLSVETIDSRRLHLDPTPADRSIDDYQKRVASKFPKDRQKIHV